MTNPQSIPEEVMKSAEAVSEAILEKAVSIVGIDDRQQFEPKLAASIIAEAIMEEKRKTAEAILYALTAHELYRYRPKAFEGFITFARETLGELFEVRSKES